MTCSDLANWVNETLGLEGENRYKEGNFIFIDPLVDTD